MMSFRIAQHVALVAATITTGLIAGLFFAFACAVMPALGRSSDRTFVEAMQKINVAILNGWFMLCFLGSLFLGILAVVLHLRRDGRSALPWIIAGLVLYVVVLAITGGVNVPLNNQLDKAGPVDRIADLSAVRVAFESKWVTWNLARTVANTAAFGCLSWALVVSR